MRDQVIAQKVGNRSGVGKGKASAGQKPARRGRESDVSLVDRLRIIAGYVPVVFKVVLAIAVGVLVFLGYRAAASASFFQVRQIEVRGATRASTSAIQTAVRKDVGDIGVWRADLKELSAHLESLPWVRVAVVTRVLPDGIRVRITERQQRAVVRFSTGRFFWVDDDAVTLGEMASTDQMPSFFLRGWNEDETQKAQTENKERVKKFLELQHDCDRTGISERVSEVNLMDLRDVRAQLAGDDSQIEIRLGAEDQSSRLQRGLEVLDKQRQTKFGPFISYLDMTQGTRAIVGLVSGGHTFSDTEIGADRDTLITTEKKTPVKSSDAERKSKEKDQKTAEAKKPNQKRA